MTSTPATTSNPLTEGDRVSLGARISAAFSDLGRRLRNGPGWMKTNLFYSWPSTILTIITFVVLAFAATKTLRWLFTQDYTIVRVYLKVLMVNQLPNDQLYRLWQAAYLFAAAIGFMSGSAARNAYDTAIESDLPATKDSLVRFVYRFWALIALAVFFSAFATTITPFILVVTTVVVLLVARRIGWFASAGVRKRAIYIGILMILAGMMAIAGTSGLGGFAVGAVVFVWVRNEASKVLDDRAAATSASGATGSDEASRVGRLAGLFQRNRATIVGLVAGGVVWVVISLIGYSGYGWDDWGGMLVNVFVAVVGIGFGLPLGILLALGRQSKLPVIQSSSVVFIEFVRGVPLISLLLASGVLLPLFLPPAWSKPATLTLAMVVIMFFSAAYVAEIVRGGLQAVHSGQREAGQALGLKPGTVQRTIILPQALRAVIPALVGQFISLFKDTSLLFAADVVDFYNASKIATASQEFRSDVPSITAALTVVAIGFWAIAYTMSKESRRLEQRLSTRAR